MKILATLLFSLIAAAGTAPAQDAPAAPAKKPAYLTTDGYPLDTCVVSDEELDAESPVTTIEGNTFKTCCKKCLAKIEKDAATFVAKKEAAVKAQAAAYPLEVCAVSGKPLGSMGEPVALVVDNTLIKLCCKSCNKKAVANKAEITAKLQAAAFEKQSAGYAAKTCPVSGNELGAKAVAVMNGTTLVKLCSADCMDEFKAKPNAFVAKLAPPSKPATETKGAAKKDGEPAPGGEACCADGAEKKAGCCSGEAKKEGGCCEAGKKAEAGVEAKKPAAAGKKID